MSNPSVSVIVPIYNTKRFLPRSLDSLICQTFTDFEVLMIDDGSTDGSMDVCYEYVQRDKRFRMIRSEHIGVGAVRNLGLDGAAGKYVMFLDSDDYVEPAWIEALYQAAEKHPDSLCNCEFALTHPSKGVDEPQLLPGLTISQEIEKRGYYALLHHGQIMQIWTRIFHADIIRQHNLRFREDMTEGEDIVFICDYLHHCENFYYVHECLYHWVNNDVDSITRGFTAYYLDDMRIIYLSRKQHITPEFLQDFYDYSFGCFMCCLDYIWDDRNNDNKRRKIQRSEELFRDPLFQETAKHVSTRVCSQKKRMAIRTKSFHLYRLALKLCY